jgi:hypothetical protein
MTANFLRGLGWAILFSALIWFTLAGIYWIGYKHGYADRQCNLAACMSEVIKYSGRDK